MRQQRFNFLKTRGLGEFRKNVPQVTVRFDVIGLARFNQTVQICRGLGTGHTVAE